MSVIACNSLTKTYGRKNALNQLTIELEENKITGLIGRNGAGKTTLLKIIAGHLKKSSGEINVFSEDPFNNLKVSANVIFIHEQMNLPTSLNLSEILSCAGRFYENWDHDLSKRLFSYFSFYPKQRYDSLSKGMESTFHAILGLSARCAVTIFDEPTNGMDAAVRKDFYRALLKEYIAYPRTMLISSHHLEEIEDLIEDVLLIEKGKKLLHLPAAELKEWAIGLQGRAEAVNEAAKGKDILHSKNIGSDHLYLVIRNDFSEEERKRIHASSVVVSAVPPTDVCVYLTEKKKGGIDDVFSQS